MAYQTSVEELQKKLTKDEEWLKDVKDGLKKSHQLRENIGIILDNFQEKISHLNDTILPLHQKTSIIQKKQQNIKKLLNIIDASIQFYGKTMELENFVRDGSPAQNLDEFLEKMDSLKEAIAFFSSHNAYESQMDNMKQTFEAGCTCLESEFGTLIKNESIILDPIEVLKCLNDEYELMNFRLTNMRTIKNYDKLNKIAKWMIKNSTITQILQKYSKIRSEIILKIINSIIEQQKKDEKEKNYQMKSAFLSALKKAAGKNSEKLLSNSELTDLQKDPQINQILLQMAGFLILSQLETDVCTLIFENVKEIAIVFCETIAKPLRIVLEDSNKIIDDYKGNYHGILLMTKFVIKNSNQLSTLSENVNEKQLFTIFNKNLFRKSYNLINDFIDKLNNDHHGKFVPEDGNVHQITANTVNFLKLLAKNRSTVGQILDYNFGNGNGKNSDVQFSKLFAQILSALGGNLKLKASIYQDEYLSALFMLNNLNHVRKCLQDDNIQSILAEQNDQLSNFYKNEVIDYQSKYLRSWTRVTSIFASLEFLQDKKSIKNCIVKFNNEFDSIVETQKNYCVADILMVKEIRRKIKELVLKPYQEFCNRFSKNYSMDRQMKYDVESVEIIIDRLFDASS